MGRFPRRGVVLSALGVAAFQLVGTVGATHNQPDRRGLDALAVVLVLLGPLALAWRDRHPLLVLAAAEATVVAYLARGYAYGPVFVSVVVAVVTAAQSPRRRPTWAVAGAGYLAYVVGAVVDGRSDADGATGVPWLQLAVVAGWLALLLVVGELVRVRRSQASDARRRAEADRRRRESEQRLGLAQELHDVLAHNISLINVQASVALHLLDEHPEQAGPALAHIKVASSEALHELRTALDLLRHGDRPDAPRSPAPDLGQLDALVAGVRASGLDVSLVRSAPGSAPLDALPAAVQVAAYRIVQEALTNVARHGAASRATVTVAVDGDAVRVEVIDDGAGGTGPARPGNGITGMQERAAALGGTLEAGPRAVGGFRVAARLPLRARVEPAEADA